MSRAARREFEFENSRVVLETGPVGTLARVEYDSGDREFAGPLPDETLDALREIADGGDE